MTAGQWGMSDKWQRPFPEHVMTPDSMACWVIRLGLTNSLQDATDWRSCSNPEGGVAAGSGGR